MYELWCRRKSKGINGGMGEQPSDGASTRYEAYLTAGVERWREYRNLLAPLSKKPILFVMLNSTAEAEDVGDYLRGKYPEDFGADKMLITQPDKSGEISKRGVGKSRQTTR